MADRGAQAVDIDPAGAPEIRVGHAPVLDHAEHGARREQQGRRVQRVQHAEELGVAQPGLEAAPVEGGGEEDEEDEDA